MSKITPELIERNKQIAMAMQNTPPRGVAEKFGLSYSHVFRAAADGRKRLAPAGGVAARGETFSGGRVLPAGDKFKGVGSTGLRRFGGTVDEEYDRGLKSLQKRVATFKEMADDPVIAAVLQAIKMTIRRVSWKADTDGKTDADKQARDFLDQCLHDMTQSWSDSIDQALGMMQYGFYPAEMVFKRRQGPARVTVETDGNKIYSPKSLYNDGRIGWGEWIFIAPDSLTPGDEWIFDEVDGTVLGLNQSPPPNQDRRSISAKKLIQFRTTAEKGNPEGRSLLRAMFKPWFYKNNFEEIEGISGERTAAGLPVVYLGSDVQRDMSSDNSEAAEYKNITTNIRIDDQMGVVVPHKKMGMGLPNDDGVLLELLSPAGKGAVDFNQVIVRNEERMSMVGLAQFIHLGMNGVGARALGESSLDFFTLAASGWVDSLADTIDRQGVETMIGLNHFPGLTCVPYLTHDPVMRASLKETAEYINGMVGSKVLTPGPELEAYVRQLGDLPASPILLNSETPEANEPEANEDGELNLDDTTEGELQLFAADHGDTVMIALYPPKELAQKLAIKGAEHWRDLHMTLAIVPAGGMKQEAVFDKLYNIVRGFALLSKPLAGEVTGGAMFAGKDGVSPNVVLVDVPGLPAWRQRLVELLALNGFRIANDHGYIPHMTLEYVEAGKPSQSVLVELPQPIRFEKIYLVMNNTKRTSFGLSGGDPIDESLEVFSVRGAGRPGARRAEEIAVNAYQAELQRIYDDWADEVCDELAAADEDDYLAILDEELPGLLAALQVAGRTSLPAAVTLGLASGGPRGGGTGFGGVAISPAMLSTLAQSVQANESTLTQSVIPAVRAKLEAALRDPDVKAAIANGTGAAALKGAITSTGSRVGARAGEFWKLYNQGVGESARESEGEVIGYLDAAARHCTDCAQFHSVEGKVYASMDAYLDATGNRVPGEFQCGGGCRCRIEVGTVKQRKG